MITDTDIRAELERLAASLEHDNQFRLLRAVPRRFTNMPQGPAPDGRCIAIVDTETTGLNIDEHKLIELAIMLVWVDDDSEVVAHMGPCSWLEDPGVEIEPRISLLTGLANHDLVGHTIDDRFASGLLDRADLVVAHNAGFDRKWLDQRYPQHAAKPWACSCSEIDWLLLGLEGRAQQHLLMQHGWFANAHRAGDDVWSLFHLLQQRRTGPGGAPERTHLARLLEAADADSVLVEATRAPFAAKDRLKARGYRWNARRRVWGKELGLADVDSERRWFDRNGLPPFDSETRTACERHR